ncbi:SDR family oxidoreductase [Leptolyngbya sp. FACHB-261]|uniref:SDR family oxidoreductase n=1 Tax=Leptolyngbya sp. FACHB-261 TaxID=2692806 RepID=UPI001689457B|nr:SDR family oxidoreductase [Leptolyngbya sp. FACHB-261]MBD2100652.1 SDR family oxidoreductase [Leptolyngbya sp. FACHB-261]
MKLKPISQQVVAIIGASSGIGRETALRFAKKGAKVVVSARSQDGLNSLVEEIQLAGGEAFAVPADVSDFEQVKAVADKTVQIYGRLDTWVHAAATAIFARFEEITPEEFKRVVDVSLMGQVYGAMAALPHLKREGRGALIHISSVEARRSLPLQSPYSCSKHGVEGFLDSLRVELMHEGSQVSVTNVMPGVINTPFYNKSLTKLGVKPMAIPPFYEPSLVADAILHVAEHPTRDIVVGEVGKLVDLLQRVSPGLMDSLLAVVGFKGQKTDEPKTEHGPNNLYEPIPGEIGYDRVKGDFEPLTIPSISNLLDQNPLLTWGALAVAVLGAAAALGGIGQQEL